MSEFGSVLDDLYAGTAPVQIADVAPTPVPKEKIPYLRYAALALLVFAILFLTTKVKKPQTVANTIKHVEFEPVLDVHEPSRDSSKDSSQFAAKEVPRRKDASVFSITGTIPISEEETFEDHKISADKLDPAIEKYLTRE